MFETFETYKKGAITAAEELFYSQAVIDKLKAAKTEADIEHIMISARRGEIE